MNEYQGFADLMSSTKEKKDFLQNLLNHPEKIVELFSRSSKEDVEMLFQKKCSGSTYQRFLDLIKSKFTANQFLEVYSIHMSDAQGGFGGIGLHSFLTVADRHLLKQKK